MIDKGHGLYHKDCKIHFFLYYVFIPHTYSFLDLDHNSCSVDRERIWQSRPSSLMCSVFPTILIPKIIVYVLYQNTIHRSNMIVEAVSKITCKVDC